MDYIKTGIIVKPHGIAGNVKVMPLTDDITRFKRLKSVFLDEKGQKSETEVERVSLGPDSVNMKLLGIDSREQAETLRGKYVFVKREQAIKLKEGAYFIFDLEGCLVKDDKGFEYGTLAEVLQTGANDVYVVKGERQWLVPALKKLIMAVDIEKKLITISSKVATEVIPDAD